MKIVNNKDNEEKEEIQEYWVDCNDLVEATMV